MPGAILKHIPGMRTAPSVPVLNVEDLSEKVFVDDYVAHSKPCIIRGAAKHWPALQKWGNADYVKKRCGHHKIFLIPHEYHLSLPRNDVGKKIVTFSDAIDFLQAPGTKMGMFATNNPTELAPDTAGFPFLTKPEPAFTYAALRYFFYRAAGTTWHYHPFDETLMCQVIGAKQIGLLKVDVASHKAIRHAFLTESYYDDPSAFDRVDAAHLNWLTATLEEGDALYIPQMWWHGVSPIGGDFGITVAACWRSPLPVLADSIRRMASGEIEMIGMHGANDEFQRILSVAKPMGLGNELMTAWSRGL